MPVKLSEEVSVEAEVHYPITCGDSKAMLIWRKFVCPGINIKCVQVRVCASNPHLEKAQVGLEALGL